MLIYSLCLAMVFGVYLFAAKKTYRSQATLLASFSQAQSAGRRAEEIQNEIRLIISRDALLAVAEAVGGPQTSHRDVQRIQAYLGQNFHVAAVPGSDLIAASFDFPAPLTAQKILRALIERYLGHRGLLLDQDGKNSHQERLALAEGEYLKAGSALESFEKSHSVFDERQLGVLNESREQLQILLNSLSNEYAYTLRKRNHIQEMLQNLPKELLLGATEVMNERYVELSERLARARGALESQLRRQRPDGQAVAGLRQEVGKLEQALKNEPRRVLDSDEKDSRLNEARDMLNRQLLELMPEVEAQMARMENIRQQVVEIDEALTGNAEAGGEHSRLVAERDLKKAAYDRLREAYSASFKGLNGTGISVSLVESPSFNPAPVRPDLPATLGLGLLLLFGGNAILLTLCPKLDKTVYCPEQAEQLLGLPVLTVMDEERDSDIGPGQRLPPYYEQHKGELQEIYHTLMTDHDEPNVILFTSAERGDVSLAEAFTSFVQFYQERRPVLVRYPSAREDAGADEDASAQKALRARPSGLTIYERVNPGIAKERTLWDKLREDNETDLLIIEHEPMRQDALLIALTDYVGAAVVRVKAGQSRKAETYACVDTLRRYGVKLAGLVFQKT